MSRYHVKQSAFLLLVCSFLSTLSVVHAAKLIEKTSHLQFDEEFSYAMFAEYPSIARDQIKWKMEADDPEGLYRLKVRPSKGFVLHNALSELNYDVDAGCIVQKPQEEKEEKGVTLLPIYCSPQKTGLLTFPIVVSFPEGQMIPKGEYGDGIEVELWCGDQFVAKESLFVQTRVEEYAEVSITEVIDNEFLATRYALVDFGIVDGTVSKVLNLGVRANYDYDVEIESKNHGKLKWEAPLDVVTPKTVFMDYSLLVDNQEIQLGGGTTVLRHLGNLSPMRGNRHTMQITLYPDLSRNLAGKYRDQILISVISTS